MNSHTRKSLELQGKGGTMKLTAHLNFTGSAARSNIPSPQMSKYLENFSSRVASGIAD